MENEINRKEVIEHIRETHKKLSKVTSDGYEGWITSANWGYGVRFYPINTGYVGMIENVEYGGDIKLIERL